MYEGIAARFNLSDADKKLPAPGDPQAPHYQKNIQWAKQQLVVKGEVDASRRGIWKITEKGRARLGIISSHLFAPSPPAPPIAPEVSSQAPPRPVMSLTDLIETHLHQLKQGLFARMGNLSAEQFEELVAEFLKRLSYSEVRRVGGPGDRNIDVTAAYQAPFVKIAIRVQVKHRRGGPNIGPSDVAAFRDRAGGVDHSLIMVTNVEFTDGAKETASEQGRQSVHLIDGNDLIHEMIEKRIGVREGSMGVLEIDEQFWDQF